MHLLSKRFLSAFIFMSLPLSVFAFDFWQGEIPLQVGGFGSSQGTAQNINIQGLIGNQYTVNNNNQGSALGGVGYFIDVWDKDMFQLLFGANAFYLGQTSVNGTVVQEQLFTNLAYSYNIQNTPLYFDAKAKIKTGSEKYNLVVDAGIGPNFMRTSQYREMPLNSYTLPDNAFAGQNQTVFAATAGVGVRINNVFGKFPVECGYRFFYLGQGQLQMNNSQLLNTVSTGSSYANAGICSIIV